MRRRCAARRPADGLRRSLALIDAARTLTRTSGLGPVGQRRSAAARGWRTTPWLTFGHKGVPGRVRGCLRRLGRLSCLQADPAGESARGGRIRIVPERVATAGDPLAPLVGLQPRLPRSSRESRAAPTATADDERRRPVEEPGGHHRPAQGGWPQGRQAHRQEVLNTRGGHPARILTLRATGMIRQRRPGQVTGGRGATTRVGMDTLGPLRSTPSTASTSSSTSISEPAR